jgi:hypothetical protein
MVLNLLFGDAFVDGFMSGEGTASEGDWIVLK